MADRMVELAKQRAELRDQLREVNAEMARELKMDNTDEAPAAPRTAQRTAPPVRRPATPARNTTRAASAPRNREPAPARTQPANDSGDRQPPLKEVVQDILGRNPDGMELRDIVREVTRMKEAGEYKTNAKSITAVVSQAINQLKQDELIDVQKSEANRNLYTLGTTD